MKIKQNLEERQAMISKEALKNEYTFDEISCEVQLILQKMYTL